MKNTIISFFKNPKVILALVLLALVPSGISSAQKAYNYMSVQRSIKAMNREMEDLFDTEAAYSKQIRHASEAICDVVDEKKDAEMTFEREDIKTLCEKSAAPRDIVKTYRNITEDFLLVQ